MKILMLCFLMISASTLTAETKSAHINGINNGLGAGGTVYKTWGFMYRHHFANNLGFSTSLGGWLDRHWGHLGNELGVLYTLAHHEFDWSGLPNSSIRVYLAGYLANIYRNNYHNYDGKNRAGRHSWEIGLGAGPGLEFFFNRYFGVHLELPWMTFVNVDKDGLSFLSSYPHIGGGLIYYF